MGRLPPSETTVEKNPYPDLQVTTHGEKKRRPRRVPVDLVEEAGLFQLLLQRERVGPLNAPRQETAKYGANSNQSKKRFFGDIRHVSQRFPD